MPALRPAVLFTTTSTIDGYRIDRYIGPITSHVVIGTGLLTDYFSAWTDLFGARSRSYQNKLDEIEQLTMNLLEDKARTLGANAVIGLRVDFDEIAGSGKSMLMVTAMGTAVKASQLVAEPSPTVDIGDSDLQAVILRQTYVERAQNTKLEWTDEVWEFATQHAVVPLAQSALAHALERAAPLSQFDDFASQSWFLRLEHYYRRLPEEVIEPLLYSALVDSAPAHRFALLMLQRLDLFRPQRVLDLLRSQERLVTVWALQAIRAVRTRWDSVDLSSMEQLIGVIPQAFVEPLPFVEEKGVLGRTKRTWVCLCGYSAGGDRDTCNACSRDRFGFAPNQLRPHDASVIISSRVRALKELLARTEMT
jgi:uncharacterized protein YbjQ (UPF0145 family)